MSLSYGSRQSFGEILHEEEGTIHMTLGLCSRYEEDSGDGVNDLWVENSIKALWVPDPLALRTE